MTAAAGAAAAQRWLVRHPEGASAGDAFAFFDALPAVAPGELTGRWRGRGLPTGSPLDGLLEAHGWYGKEFVDAETVRPLLFRTRSGPRPVDLSMIPLGVLRDPPALAHSRLARAAFAVVRPLLSTSRPKARLRTVEHRGVVTAALVYDALPIIDVFRRVSGTTVLGLMDLRGADPFFFVLRRE